MILKASFQAWLFQITTKDKKTQNRQSKMKYWEVK